MKKKSLKQTNKLDDKKIAQEDGKKMLAKSQHIYIYIYRGKTKRLKDYTRFKYNQ
jgi:hypothetical protein